MQPAKKKDIKQVINILESRGYKIFTRPYELNIVGIRNKDVDPTNFDDTLYVFWKDAKGKWEFRAYAITTDPSDHYLKNPLEGSGGGTAILKEGQYLDAYQLGFHRGEYLALVQRGPVTIYRDYDRNAIMFMGDGSTTTGLYGINIHRAKAAGTTNSIDLYSAGCQVFANAEDFAEFLGLAQKQRDLYGNSFTYTLIDEWIRAQYRRRTTLGVGAGAAALVGLGIIFFAYLRTHTK